MEYLKPNLEHEWNEALRYREFEKMGKEEWINYAKSNFQIEHYNSIKDKLGNVDLDYSNLNSEKKKRFEHSFKKGKIEIPIAVKFSENDYDLLGGNTRLSGLISKGINPKLWVIDMEKKKEVKEQGADSSGSYEGAAFGSVILKKDIHKLKNLPNAKSYNVNEEEEFHEDGIQSSGAFDVPAFGKTTKGGRRDPLKIDGPDSIYKGRAVTDKKFPRYGGPKGVFVKIKEKCKKFPYCNQGNTGAIEFIHEDQELQDAINETSKKYGIPVQEVEKIVLNEISKIFI